jgi:hypothetical protein
MPLTRIKSLGITDGTIVNADINASAAIAGTKLSGVGITLGTAVNSTSGTSIDFTGLPSSVKRITVMFSGVSTNGTSVILIQLGDSGGVETTGYLGAGGHIQENSSLVQNFTSGFGTNNSSTSSCIYHGSIVLTNVEINKWVANGSFGRSDATFCCFSQGSKTLSDTLDRVRITTVNGTDTFDAGSINISYE